AARRALVADARAGLPAAPAPPRDAGPPIVSGVRPVSAGAEMPDLYAAPAEGAAALRGVPAGGGPGGVRPLLYQHRVLYDRAGHFGGIRLHLRLVRASDGQM